MEQKEHFELTVDSGCAHSRKCGVSTGRLLCVNEASCKHPPSHVQMPSRSCPSIFIGSHFSPSSDTLSILFRQVAS